MGTRYGDLAKTYGPLAFYQDSNPRYKGWSTYIHPWWEEGWGYRSSHHLQFKGDSLSCKGDQLSSSCMEETKESIS